MSEYITRHGPPEQSPWHCILIGCNRSGQKVIYRPELGMEPNRFHRAMHRLLFGFKWERDQ